jgi:ribonuclease Z
MTKFSVLILGNASASPTLGRNPTSQLINIDEQYYLMDCGEGTQSRLRAHKVKLQRIHHIFISHLHGDHYLGLIGLLQTMSLLGRTTALKIYCPGNIKEIVDVHLKYSESYITYPIEYQLVSTENSEVVFENNKITVSTIPLSHRIACVGYLFKQKTKPKRINPAAVKLYGIPKYELNKIKLGEDYSDSEGKIIKNELVTHPSLPSFSYAFCSDTKYEEKIIDVIRDVSLLYHEATFTEEHADRAKKTFHSTAKQAAQIALKSNANKLIIGHFSNRYPDLNVLLTEAKSVFKNTEIATQDYEFEIS